MTFKIELTEEQSASLCCEVLCKIIKDELDKKKETGRCDGDLIKAAKKIIKQYMADDEYMMFIEVVENYLVK
jgi:hypothetical protein